MKNTKRLLITLVLAIGMIFAIATVTAGAEGGTVVFLTPNTNWKADNARFAVYVWDDAGSHKWVDMTDSNGDGIYEAVIPEGYNHLIFVRMSSSALDNKWDNKWNQTEDLTLPTNGDNHYTVKSGTWDKGGGSWSYLESDSCIHTPSGEGTVIKAASCSTAGEISHTCSKCGESYKAAISATGHDFNEHSICTICGKELIYIIAGNVMKADGEYRQGDNETLFVSKWDIEDENNRMQYDPDAEVYFKIYKNVAAGEYHFKIVQDKSWDTSYGDGDGNCYIKVDQDGSTVIITFANGKISVASDLPKVPDNNNSNNNSNTDNDDDKAPSNPGSNNSGDKTDEGGSNEPQQKLNFFQKIWLAITNFFKKLFGKKQ